MAEVPTPPTPPTPKAAVKGGAKGLKGILSGKPTWMWIAGFTVLVGVAVLAYRREKNAPLASDDPEGADFADGGGYYTSSPVTGSYGGYDMPIDTGSAGGGGGGMPGYGYMPSADPAPAMEPMEPFQIELVYPEQAPAAPESPSWSQLSEFFAAVNAQQAAAARRPTGGGTQPKRSTVGHKPTPEQARQTAIANRSVVAAAQAKGKPAPFPTGKVKNEAKAPPGFPHPGNHGYYRNERDKKGHYHLYQSGKKVYVK